MQPFRNDTPNESLGSHPPDQVPSSSGSGFPFQGDFKGVTWNSNAFFCADKLKELRKQNLASKWLEQHDFIVLQEAHSTEERTESFQSFCLLQNFGLRSF